MNLAIKTDVHLKDLTTFRLGGPAEYTVDITNLDELREALLFAQKEHISFKVIGGGSNILAKDAGMKGLLIRNHIKGIKYTSEADYVFVSAGAGESWDALVADTVEKGLFGLENLSLIPGTVGASPIQNIGAYGVEVKKTIHSVEVYDVQESVITHFSNAECQFGYRDSIFKRPGGERYIVLRVTFRLKETGDTFIGYRDLADYFVRIGIARATPAEVREAVIEIRTAKLPDTTKVGTAGSFFKNPVVTSEQFDELKKKFPDLPGYAEDGAMKISLGWVLDKMLNMRGVCMGDACVHDRQALVIINKGNATSSDVDMLAQDIEKKVVELLGINIEREVREF